MLKAYSKYVWIVAMCFSIATQALADDAPVFEIDGDRFPPAIENAPEPQQIDLADQDRQSDYPQAQTLTFQQRLSRIEQQMKNMERSKAASQVDSLQKEVQALRGQVEELNHALQQAQNQQRTMYTDLDNRLAQLSAKPKTASNPADDADVQKPKDMTTSSSSVNTRPSSVEVSRTVTASSAKTEQPNAAEEEHIYQTAYDLIKSKKYDQAIVALKKMLQKYPTGQFAANAHFWLGELYGLLSKNDQSAEEFANVIKNYPDSPKVADAQLKLGLIYMAQFKWDDAKAAFKKVVGIAPGTASSQFASEQLRQIRKAGH